MIFLHLNLFIFTDFMPKNINLKAYFHAAREYLQPILRSSKFQETGVLTPEEFIFAGDFLVSKCPTWEWCSGHKDQSKPYLPTEKQYLISRSVPCSQRVSDMQQIVETNENDSVLISHQIKMEISDLDDLDTQDTQEFPNDPAGIPHSIMPTRKYNISISYDKYYQTPRTWITGFDENMNPLSPKEMFQDISQDHAKVKFTNKKTCTIEQHPHERITCASIHPCQHANVMKQ